jgi:uncharacterized membrane protein YGL010W
MPNSTQTLFSTENSYSFDPAKHYEELSSTFSNYHSDPVNVALHFLTTPLGMIGLFSLLRSYTKSSSITIAVTFFYLLSLLPILPSGDFYGTALLCFVIVFCSRVFRLKFVHAVILVALGYVLQDLSHVATGESTFQSTYSNGGHVSLIFENDKIFLLLILS